MRFVFVVNRTVFSDVSRHMLWENMFETSLPRCDIDSMCILFRKFDAGLHSMCFFVMHVLRSSLYMLVMFSV